MQTTSQQFTAHICKGYRVIGGVCLAFKISENIVATQAGGVSNKAYTG